MPFGRVLPEAERVRRPRAERYTPRPRRLGHHACRHYDRRARCIAVTEQAARAAMSAPLCRLSGSLARRRAFGTKVPLVRTAVERRQASAPTSGGRRKPPYSVARPARRLRAGSTTLRLPAFRFLLFRGHCFFSS